MVAVSLQCPLVVPSFLVSSKSARRWAISASDLVEELGRLNEEIGGGNKYGYIRVEEAV